MKMHSFWEWRDRRRFPALYQELHQFEGVSDTVDQIKTLIKTAVVEHEYVYEGYIQPYLKLADAFLKLTEALFELCPNGVVRFEVTDHGLKLLFRTSLFSNGKIFTMIDIGWVYAGAVAETVEKTLSETGMVMEELAYTASTAHA